jgi:hypothetical protein
MDAECEALLAVINKRLDDFGLELTEARASWVAAVTALAVALGAKGILVEDDIPRMIRTADTIAGLLDDAIARGETPEEWFKSWISEPWTMDPKPRRKGGVRRARGKKRT